jgi:hypothetical protein
MTKQVANSTRKFLAAGGVAFALAGLGMLAGAGAAAADGTMPDTGSYDELFRVGKAPLQQDPDTGSSDELLDILDSNGFQAARP